MAALPRVRALVGRQGVTFTNSFVNVSDCCPSRATFLTGQYAHNHHVLSNVPPDGGFYRLNSDKTLAVWLQRAGYYTAFVGKYLNDYGRRDPEQIPPGWDEWDAAVDSPTPISRTKFSYYDTVYNRNGDLKQLPHGVYRTDADAQTARQIIGGQARSRQPFFMWLCFLAPHGGRPIEPDDPTKFSTPAVSPRDRDRFRRVPLPHPPSFDEVDVSDKPSAITRKPLTAGRQRDLRELFQQRWESLLAVDRAVASVMAALRRAGKLDNTLVILTSDNGFMLGEHRLGPQQQYIYEPAIRVPLLMRGPGLPRNQRRSQLVVNADLAPTILDFAHARADLTVDGRSLRPVLANPRLPWKRDLLVEYGPHFKEKQLWGLRTPRYAYAEYADGETELYDLRRDPNELSNVTRDRRYARVRAALANELEVLKRCKGRDCAGSPSSSGG